MSRAVPAVNSSLVIRNLTGLLLVMFPVGLLMMLYPTEGLKFLWSTSLFLFLEALVLFLVLVKLSGVKNSFIVTLIIFTASFAVELIGVKTSYPFGSYSYTDILIPQLFGVPIAIGFAWIAVCMSSYFLVRYYMQGYSMVTVSFVSALMITATDIMLEPFASFINKFWLWNSNYISPANYVSWFYLGFIFCILLDVMVWKNKKVTYTFKLSYYPLVIFLVNVLFFGIVNVVNGFTSPALTGFIGIVAVFFILINIKRPNGV